MSVLQDSISEAAYPSSSQIPPLASTISFDRIFTRVPAPHVVEQGPNVHSVHTQSTAGAIRIYNKGLINFRYSQSPLYGGTAQGVCKYFDI